MLDLKTPKINRNWNEVFKVDDHIENPQYPFSTNHSRRQGFSTDRHYFSFSSDSVSHNFIFIFEDKN